MTNEPPHIDPEELRRLGIPEVIIKGAQKMEERGLLDVRPSADLVERTMERIALEKDVTDGKIEPQMYVLHQRYLVGDKKCIDWDIKLQRTGQAFDTFVLCLYERWKSNYQIESEFFDGFDFHASDENGNRTKVSNERAKEVLLAQITESIGDASRELERRIQKLPNDIYGQTVRREKPLYVILSKTSNENVTVKYSQSLDEKLAEQNTEDVNLKEHLVNSAGWIGHGKEEEFAEVVIDFLFEEKLGIPTYYLHAKQDGDTVWLQYVKKSL